MRFSQNLFIIGAFLFIFSTASAQSADDFIIRISGGIDIVPPSTPTLQSVVPVEYSQIDIGWTTATDNVQVAGYLLYRNGLPLATTTLTSYSDIGLTASTTYAYYVQAFDASLNYSTSSNVIATTTPGQPVVVAATSSNPSQGTATRAVLDSLSIEPAYVEALFTISTKHPARVKIRWGRTTSYELGYVVNDIFLSEYKTRITDLEPGTTYEYEILGYTPRGAESVLKSGQFKTLTDESVSIEIPNVSRFKSTVDATDVKLSWEIPDVEDIAYLRIVRSYFSYPTNLQNGAVVYQGLGSNFTDVDVLSQYSPVYYTAFVVDTEGNVSSGSITSAYLSSNGGGNVTDSIDVTPIIIFDDNATTENADETENPTDFQIPDLKDIFVYQDNTRFTFASEAIELDSMTAFTISIPKNSVAQNLKSLIVSVTDPSDTREQYSFLLKINKDQTAYEATVPALGVVGGAWIAVDIYDYESKMVSSYRKKVSFVEQDALSSVVIFPDLFMTYLQIIIPILLAVFLWVLFIFYRSKKSEDKA